MIPIVLGPTAVGKTSLLVKLAERLPLEAVSLDSRQVYRYMDVGTAKPTREERVRLKHWLIDIKNPDESFDANQYRKLALEKISQIIRRGKIPVLVGGTGLYAEVVLKGLAKVPGRDEKLREALLQLEADHKGILRKLLKSFDREASLKIHENDLKRTVRYLETFFLTGKPLTSLQKEVVASKDYGIVLLSRERGELHERISRRVRCMLESGLEEETRALLERGYSSELNALKTIGYAEMVQYIRGVISLAEAVELIERNTRRYARRQLIWFARYESAFRLDLTGKSIERAVEELEDIILTIWGGKHG